MWNKIAKHLEGHPERLDVARLLVETGLSIRDGRIYCNQIEIPTVRIAKAAGVDRRTVGKTIQTITSNPELREIFARMRSAGLSLREIAKYLGFGVLEITPHDPHAVGILAKASTLIAEENISIRQAIVDDPELSPEPKLTLIAETMLPGDLIPKVLKIPGIAKVSVY
ncbi:MAG: amino acid-binding protein [Candidatus Bathyarchaeia archaeon]